MKRNSFLSFLKSTMDRHEKPTTPIYIGLNMKGVADLAVEGGEPVQNLHVTLLYGFLDADFPKFHDNDDATVRIHSAIEAIQEDIPDTLHFDRIGRFKASESSNGKDVIYAQVEKGQLEELHNRLLQELKKYGIEVKKTFSTYTPHMTLKYVDPDEEHPLTEIDHTGTIKSLTYGIGQDGVGEGEEHRTVAKTFNEILKFNPYHASDGKFTSKGGGGAGVAFMTIRTKDPKKQHWADMAIARAKGEDTKAKPKSTQPKETEDKELRTSNKAERGHRTASDPFTVMKDCKVNEKKAADYKEAVRRYSGQAYQDIRSYQQGKKGADAETKKLAKDLEEFIDKSPQWNGGEVYRGMHVNEGSKLNLKPGAVIDMGGTSSWSSRQEIAKLFSSFGGSKEQRIVFVASSPGKATSIKHLSKFQNEDEVLSSKDNQYKVRKTETVTSQNGTSTLYVYVDPTSGYKGKTNIVGKSSAFNVFKSDDDKRLVFGWANISRTKDGKTVLDLQGDTIEPEDLEEAAYEYVLHFRDTGEEHISSLRKKGKLVESVVFTKEKMQAMKIPEGILPEGWWVGFYIEDDDAWEKVKNGTYQMFSIEGKGQRIPLEKSAKINGCGVIVVREDGKILTGTRIVGKHANQICGPGGHVESGETPQEAAIRETAEEFGITPTDLTQIEIQDGGRAYGKSAIFLCTEYDGEPQTDEEEMTDLKWRSITELQEEKLYEPFRQSLELIEDALYEAEEGKAVAKTFNEILKFNPYHAADGKFTSKGGGAATFMTITTRDPKKQHWADMAMARAKEEDLKGSSAGEAKESEGTKTITKEDAERMRKEMYQDIDTEDYKAILSMGTGYIGTSNSFEINEALRNNDFSNPDYMKTVQAMDRSMKPLPEGVKVTRYVDVDFLDAFGIDVTNYTTEDVVRRFKGAQIEEKGYMSTSYDSSKSYFTNRIVRMEMNVPKGKKAFISPFDDEAEIVMSRGTRYTIKNIRPDREQFIFEIDVLSDE